MTDFGPDMQDGALDPGGIVEPEAPRASRGPIIIIAAIAAVILLFAVIGGLVYAFLLHATQPVTPTVSTIATTATSASRSKASSETTTMGERVSVPVTNQDVFVFRDPFEPVVKAATEASTTSSTSTTGSAGTTSTAGDANVLTLVNIMNVDGVYKAALRLGGQQYIVAAGERLGDSPWKVLTVSKTSVTMLYGEEQVTLALGEGVGK
jgi:hypothetical protein